MTATINEDADTRIFCKRFPVGWDAEELRLEAFAAADGEEFGRVFLTDADGKQLELPWHLISDLGSAMVDCESAIWEDFEKPGPKAPDGNG